MSDGARLRGGFVLDSHALLAYFEGEASGAPAPGGYAHSRRVVKEKSHAPQRREAGRPTFVYASASACRRIVSTPARSSGTRSPITRLTMVLSTERSFETRTVLG